MKVRPALVFVLIVACLTYGLRMGLPFKMERTMQKYGLPAETRYKIYFAKNPSLYPPDKLTFIVLKQEKQFELWAERGGQKALVHTYEIKAASGDPGPKLKEGDGQVPEGVYRITALNPASAYHLSMRLDYPNAFDREKAKTDHRKNLGGDIYIHGGDVSIGCIALGDAAIEELFVQVYKTGMANVKVIVMPSDLRRGKPIMDLHSAPAWIAELHKKLIQEVSRYKE